jgi:hypothetical protein
MNNGFIFRLSLFIRSYYNYLQSMLRACRVERSFGPGALLSVEKPGEGVSIGAHWI